MIALSTHTTLAPALPSQRWGCQSHGGPGPVWNYYRAPLSVPSAENRKSSVWGSGDLILGPVLLPTCCVTWGSHWPSLSLICKTWWLHVVSPRSLLVLTSPTPHHKGKLRRRGELACPETRALGTQTRGSARALSRVDPELHPGSWVAVGNKREAPHWFECTEASWRFRADSEFTGRNGAYLSSYAN